MKFMLGSFSLVSPVASFLASYHIRNAQCKENTIAKSRSRNPHKFGFPRFHSLLIYVQDEWFEFLFSRRCSIKFDTQRESDQCRQNPMWNVSKISNLFYSTNKKDQTQIMPRVKSPWRATKLPKSKKRNSLLNHKNDDYFLSYLCGDLEVLNECVDD